MSGSAPPPIPGRARRGKHEILVQALFLLVLGGLLWGATLNFQDTVATLRLTQGYGFLWRATEWNVSASLVPHSHAAPYWATIAVGLANTLLVGLFCVAVTTVVGFLIGLLSISSNNLLRWLASCYVALVRNVPALLHVLFWYNLFKNLPPARAAVPIFDHVFVTNRGLYLPSLDFNAGMAGIGAVAIAGYFVSRLLRKGRILSLSVGVLAGIAAFLLTVSMFAPPFEMEKPELRGFNIVGGHGLAIEIVTMMVALSIYSSAFIGEIVRGGLVSVPRGQIEAARSLGLPGWLIDFKIRIPLAMRAIIPALGNQHLFTVKLTSLGIAIGFSELFSITSITINHTGQTIEPLLLMMIIYLACNYIIIFTMHAINGYYSLPGR